MHQKRSQFVDILTIALIHFSPESDKVLNDQSVSNLIENSNCELSEIAAVPRPSSSSSSSNNRLRIPRRNRRRSKTPSFKTKNDKRRILEDNLATIFLGMVLVFLLCHLLRICVDVHELMTLEHANECRKAGYKGFPAWSIIAIYLSHVFLVLNSSINILIYCGLSSKFREEFCKIFCS